MIWAIIVAILAVIAICIAYILVHKWHYAYCSVKARYQKLQSENIKLQQEIYKLTYKVPDVPKGKREK